MLGIFGAVTRAMRWRGYYRKSGIIFGRTCRSRSGSWRIVRGGVKLRLDHIVRTVPFRITKGFCVSGVREHISYMLSCQTNGKRIGGQHFHDSTRTCTFRLRTLFTKIRAAVLRSWGLSFTPLNLMVALKIQVLKLLG
jgi:hypothetical protein